MSAHSSSLKVLFISVYLFHSQLFYLCCLQPTISGELNPPFADLNYEHELNEELENEILNTELGISEYSYKTQDPQEQNEEEQIQIEKSSFSVLNNIELFSKWSRSSIENAGISFPYSILVFAIFILVLLMLIKYIFISLLQSNDLVSNIYIYIY